MNRVQVCCHCTVCCAKLTFQLPPFLAASASFRGKTWLCSSGMNLAYFSSGQTLVTVNAEPEPAMAIGAGDTVHAGLLDAVLDCSCGFTHQPRAGRG